MKGSRGGEGGRKLLALIPLNLDERNGITNDPNRPDDREHIVRLVGQVITVSFENATVVKASSPMQK